MMVNRMKKITALFISLFMTAAIFAQSESEDKNKEKEEEKLKITGRVQFRGVSGQEESTFSNGGSDYNSVDWNFRRVRLGAKYEGDFWGTVVDIKLENLLNKNYTTTSTKDVGGTEVVTKVSDKDNKGAVQEANVWVNIPFMKSRLTMGQFKAPFMREQIESSGRIMFAERSMMTNAMTQWEIGLMYGFKPLVLIDKKLENFMTVDLSVTNGHGSSSEGTGGKQVQTNTRSGNEPMTIAPLYNWRVEINPFGGLIKKGKDKGWTEGDEIFQRETKLSLGIAGAHISELHTSGSFDPHARGVSKIDILNVMETEVNGDGVNCDVPSDETSPCKPRLGVTGRTYDFTFTSHGLYLSGAYTKYSGSGSNKLRGYQGTIGYVIPYKKSHIMPVYRYDYMAGDFDHNGNIGENEIFRNHWVGVDYYVRKNDLKFQLMYQVQNDKLGTDPRTGNGRDMKNNLVYFQVQSNFSTGVSLK